MYDCYDAPDFDFASDASPRLQLADLIREHDSHLPHEYHSHELVHELELGAFVSLGAVKLG